MDSYEFDTIGLDKLNKLDTEDEKLGELRNAIGATSESEKEVSFECDCLEECVEQFIEISERFSTLGQSIQDCTKSSLAMVDKIDVDLRKKTDTLEHRQIMTQEMKNVVCEIEYAARNGLEYIDLDSAEAPVKSYFEDIAQSIDHLRNNICKLVQTIRSIRNSFESF